MHRQEPEDLLIQQAIKRDRVAFATLYDKYIDQVYQHVYYRVSDQVDAEDITQEAFIRAWKAINRYKRTGAPFVAWLIAIARNLIADHYKKAKKKAVSLEEAKVSNQSSETSLEAIVESTINRSHVKNAVSKLKGDKQKVITMRFIDGFSYREIARILHKS